MPAGESANDVRACRPRSRTPCRPGLGRRAAPRHESLSSVHLKAIAPRKPTVTWGPVERTTRQVTITDAGNLLVSRARRILAELEAATDELLALRGMETGRVRVGTMHTMGPVDVSLALAIFHERHRGVELTVREQSSEELAEMLREDEIDLAFLSVTERIESHGLGLLQLVSEELVVLLPPEHRLAGRQRLRIAELAGEEFISYREGARLRELLFAAARAAGFQPNVKLELNESQRIRRLVSRGMGVAILPRSDA